MSVYFVKDKRWRYDFTLNGTRYTRRLVQNQNRGQTSRKPKKGGDTETETSEETPTDMVFLELVNRRLDHVKAYNAERHYQEYLYLAKRWIKHWQEVECSQITGDMVQAFVLVRKKFH